MAQLSIKAIPTTYKGVKFRSRVEARWCVFFDKLGVRWRYEQQGFVLSNDAPYLCDLLLPDFAPGVFAEVKGKEFTREEAEKCAMLCEGTKQPVLLLPDVPDLRAYSFFRMEPGCDAAMPMDTYLLPHLLKEWPLLAGTGIDDLCDMQHESYLRANYPDYVAAVEAARSERFERKR